MAVVTYVEIPVEQMDRAVSFYSALFGVELERTEIDGHPMALFPDAGGEASGALAGGEPYTPSTTGILVYFAVEDIQGTVARGVELGGGVLYPVTDIGENGLVAELRDSEGNRIALSAPPP